MRKALLILLLAACAKSNATPSAAGSAVASASATDSAPAAGSAPAAAPRSAELAVGSDPPDFTTKAHDGTDVHLAALKGKPVLVYFYPKDETPGCTAEACSFRDAWDKLSAKGVVLIGISADSDASHRAFATHHKLPFLLVSDPDGAIGKSFGVPFFGVHMRQSFLIGPDGKLRSIWRNVDVTKHAGEVLGIL
jgi:peroxiredoxin Q/BCP